MPGHHAVVDQLGDRVGEPEEALLQLRALQGEEDVQHVLRGVRVPDRQVGLQEVDPGRGTMAHGVVAGGHELDDLGDVPRGAQVARYCHQDVGAVARAREDLLIDRHGARQVLLRPASPGR